MTTPPTGLADLLRERTTDLHRLAERSGVVGKILAGRANRGEYTLFLRNLVPAYCEMEAILERHRSAVDIGALFRPELMRRAAMESDLHHLAGSDWANDLPLLPSGARYAERVAAVGASDLRLLIAHVYTRYLGDLGGGPILRTLLSKSANLGAECLAFYQFSVADSRALAREYRAVIDEAADRVSAAEEIVAEAVHAFRLNIDLSEEVMRFVDDAAKVP